MKNIAKKVLIIIFIIMLITIYVCPICIVHADADDISVDDYKNIYEGGIPEKVKDVGNPIVGIVQVVGVGIAIIMLILIGMKYVLASADEKANLKGQLVIYVIGALLLFAGTTLFTIVVQTAQEI